MDVTFVVVILTKIAFRMYKYIYIYIPEDIYYITIQIINATTELVVVPSTDKTTKSTPILIYRRSDGLSSIFYAAGWVII